MSIYIEPSYMSKKQANEKTKLLNEPIIAERKEYLETHSIMETLVLPKK